MLLVSSQKPIAKQIEHIFTDSTGEWLPYRAWEVHEDLSDHLQTHIAQQIQQQFIDQQGLEDVESFESVLLKVPKDRVEAFKHALIKQIESTDRKIGDEEAVELRVRADIAGWQAENMAANMQIGTMDIKKDDHHDYMVIFLRSGIRDIITASIDTQRDDRSPSM